MTNTQLAILAVLLGLLSILPGCPLDDYTSTKTKSNVNCGSDPGACRQNSTQCCTQWEAARAHYRACVSYANAGNASAAANARKNFNEQLSRAKSICASLQSKVVPTLRGVARPGAPQARRQIDTFDATAVLAGDAQGIGDATGAPQLGVDAAGRAYVVVPVLDTSLARHQAVVSFTTGPTALATLYGVLHVPAETLIRALLVVPADVATAAGDVVVQRDSLLLVVDGYDHADQRSWREFRLVDPERPGEHVSLYRSAVEPSRQPHGSVGFLRATMAADGAIYIVEDGDPAIAQPGSIRAFAWSDSERSYRERAEPLTTAGTVAGALAAGPDGFLYAFESAEGAAVGSLLRIDVRGTDAWTIHRGFDEGYDPPAAWDTDLAFSAEGKLFLRAGGLVLPVSGRAAIGGGAIASEGAYLPGTFACGVDGTLYVVEREIDGPAAAPDLDALIELLPRR